FYQFWLNVSDEDAEKYIKIFTRLPKEEIDHLISQHREAPHNRVLHKRLGEEVTVMVHSREDYEAAVEASQILFGQGTTESLRKLSEQDLLAVFEGVPRFAISRTELEKGLDILDLLAVRTAVFPSKGEARRMIQSGGVLLNKERVADPGEKISTKALLNNKYILVQRGKKNYFLLIAG
ncbi:MAG: tyrosine--tRNA ligase, partial [Desulfobacteraceae bacterium]